MNADETERALWLLDNLPAWYRDNEPPKITHVRHEIHKGLMTPNAYSQHQHDQQVDFEKAALTISATLRGNLIEKEVKDFNQYNVTPHIIDLGPGEYWLPLALSIKNYKFTYQDIGLCPTAKAKAYPLIEEHLKPHNGTPVILVACELIEHLWNPKDILSDVMRTGITPDIIHISTPKYSYDINCENWRGRDLGHLRAYTPKEFCAVVSNLFKNHDFYYYDDVIQHLRGVIKGGNNGQGSASIKY